MNANSRNFVSRFARLATAGALFAALLGQAASAPAAVNDPPSGDWSFTIYADDSCEGSWVEQAASASYTLSIANLGTYSLNDKASSWALCNNTGKSATVSISLYTDVNYGGTEVKEASSVTVDDGLCLVKTLISPNDSISSFKVTATLK